MDIVEVHDTKKYSVEETIFSFGVKRKDNAITIFLLDTDSHRFFIEHTPNILVIVLEYYKLSSALHLYTWTFVAGAGLSEIRIDSHDNIPTTLTFQNGAVLQPYCCAFSLKTYEAAYRTDQDFQDTLLKQYSEHLRPSFFSASVTRYLALTPAHPKYTFHMMSHPYGTADDGKFPVLFVNCDLFIEYWKKQCNHKSFFLAEVFGARMYDRIDFDDRVLLSSTFEESMKHVIPSQMAASVGFQNGKIRFGNGRHRTVNLAKMGAELIPLQVNRESVEDFKRAFVP